MNNDIKPLKNEFTFNIKEKSYDNKLYYSWDCQEYIEKIRIKTDSKYIAVAHHKDDDIETYFINLIRGSGIRGFLGMKEKKNKIIRPLLNFERNEIESYLMLKNQEFRTDSSNTDTKYLRNNIRKHFCSYVYINKKT